MLLTPEERRQGIGGSDVGAIMGANPYCSIVKLYKEKKGEIPPPTLNHAMEWGNILEDVIAKKYASDNNLYFDPDAIPLNHESEYVPCPEGSLGVIYKPKIVRSPSKPWAYAHPDFFVQTGEPDKYDLSGIEVKTVSEGMYRKYWADNTIPPWQYYQVVWYSIVTGIDHWKLVGLAPHLRLSTDPILVHDLYIDADTKSTVMTKVHLFWSDLQNNTVPHIDKPSEADLKLLYPTNTMDLIQSSTTIDASVKRLYDVRLQLKPLEEEQESLKNMIKSHMGNAGRLISQEGEELASFKSPKSKVKTDYKAIHDLFVQDLAVFDNAEMSRAFDKIVADNTKAFTQTRRFLLKAKY